MATLGLIGITAFITGCAFEETDQAVIDRICSTSLVDTNKDGKNHRRNIDVMAQIVCADQYETNVMLFSMEEAVFILKAYDEYPNMNYENFIQKLNVRPRVASKFECFKSVILDYGTDDPDLMAQCKAI